MKLCRQIVTVKPRLTATSVIRSPRYHDTSFLPAWQNGHTFSCKTKPSVIRSPVNTAIFFSPLVTVSTGYHFGLSDAVLKHELSSKYRVED